MLRSALLGKLHRERANQQVGKSSVRGSKTKGKEEEEEEGGLKNFLRNLIYYRDRRRDESVRSREQSRTHSVPLITGKRTIRFRDAFVLGKNEKLHYGSTKWAGPRSSAGFITIPSCWSYGERWDIPAKDLRGCIVTTGIHLRIEELSSYSCCMHSFTFTISLVGVMRFIFWVCVALLRNLFLRYLWKNRWPPTYTERIFEGNSL